MQITDTLDQAAILGMQEQYGLTYLSVPNSFSKITKELDVTWRNFYAQSIRHKQKHQFINGVGYEYRDEKQTDFKETFHVSLEYQLPLGYSACDKIFVECSKEVIEQSKPIVIHFASQLNDIAGFDLGAMVEKSPMRWINRALNYFPRTMDQIENGDGTSAAPHPDKGLTFGLRESSPGLMVLWKGEWRPLSYLPDHIHAYAGLLTQYYTLCKLKALCHEVITTPKTEVVGRSAHVLFVDYGDVCYDKGTYGPAQETFPHGENYEMSFDEFKKYFIELEKVKVY